MQDTRSKEPVFLNSLSILLSNILMIINPFHYLEYNREQKMSGCPILRKRRLSMFIQKRSGIVIAVTGITLIVNTLPFYLWPLLLMLSCLDGLAPLCSKS